MTMNLGKMALATMIIVGTVVPLYAQTHTPPFNPSGNFVDAYGTSFRFGWCGDTGTDLCGVLTNLKGRSATPENLTFVGKQVMHAIRTTVNQWKGSLSAGRTDADATVTMVGPDTIEIQGCKAAILCETLTYTRF